MEDSRGPKPIAVKLRENLAYMRANGYSREEMQAEIQRAQSAIQREKQQDMRLTPAEKVAATGSKLASGATFGFFDEALGALGGDKDTQRYLQHQLEQENPALAMGAEIVGGLAVPGTFLSPAAKGASAVAKIGRVMGEGAIQGGLSGLGNAEGGLGNRVRGAGTGAFLGAAIPGVVSGVGRGLRGAARATGEALGMTVPSISKEAGRLASLDEVAKGRRRLGQLQSSKVPGVMVADVLEQGEGALRSAGTANRAVRRTIDQRLKGRQNLIANEADRLLDDVTGVDRQSKGRTVKELAEEARRKAEPYYGDARQEFDRAGLVPDEELPTAVESLRGEQQQLRVEQQNLREQLRASKDRLSRAVPQGDLAPLGGKVQMRDNAQVVLAERDRAAAMQRLGEIGERLVETDGLLARAADGRLPRVEGAADIERAKNLPAVKAEIAKLTKGGMHTAPRFGYRGKSGEDFDVLDQAYKNIGERIRIIGEKMRARTATMDEIDARHALIRERNVLRKAIESRAPSYGTALDTFADDKALEAAYVHGTEVRRTPADLIPDEMGRLDTDQVPFYRRGAASSLRSGDVPNLDVAEFARFKDILAPVATRESADKFRAVFGEEAYRDYLGKLLDMAGVQRLRAGMGESTTADKLMEQMQANPEQIAGLLSGLLRGDAITVARNAVPFKAIDRLRKSKTAEQNAAFLMREDVGPALDELEGWLREQTATPSRLGGSLVQRLGRSATRQLGAESGRSFRLPR